jgi:hypothetical protein
MSDITEKTSPQEMLTEVDKAIYSVLVGGQSYQIGTRKLTRADLNLLYKMKNDLTAQVAAQGANKLLDDTVCAVFSGR